MYSLDTGIVLHTFAHGLHVGIDKYPTAFLPGGFAFFGATIDGTVTIWGVKEGDRLQLVQHLCASILNSLNFHARYNPNLNSHKRTWPCRPSQYVPHLPPSHPRAQSCRCMLQRVLMLSFSQRHHPMKSECGVPHTVVSVLTTWTTL